MPNHVTNVITAAPEVIKALLDEKNEVDFTLLVPTPEDYEEEGCAHNHPLMYDENDPNAHCWYSWNRHAWGTKWNAYDTELNGAEGDHAEVRFDTAWSHPRPVVVALSEAFPDQEIVAKWADEDLGGNLGGYAIKNGNIRSIEGVPDADYSDEARDWACELKTGMTYKEAYGDDEEDDD